MKIMWVILSILLSSQLYARGPLSHHRLLRIENTDSNDRDPDLQLPSPHKSKFSEFDLVDRSDDRESGVFSLETPEDDYMDEAIESDDADVFYDADGTIESEERRESGVFSLETPEDDYMDEAIESDDADETIDSEEREEADVFLEADDGEEEPESSPVENSMPTSPVNSVTPACSLFGWRKAKEYFTKKSLELVTSGIILDNIESIEWAKQNIERRLNDPIFQKKIIQQLIRAGMGAIAFGCEKTGMMPPGTFQSVWSQITEATNMVNYLDGI